METQQKLPEEEYNRIRKLRNIALGIDGYEASEPLALGLAYLATALTATPAAPVAGPIALGLLAYCQFRAVADPVTKPLAALYIHQAYGNDAVAALEGLEAIIELIPIAKNLVDLIPTVTIAHNMYLDRLKDEGADIPDDLYIARGLWNFARPLFRGLDRETVEEHRQEHKQYDPQPNYAPVGAPT